MNLKNQSKFRLVGLNQEKTLNELSKITTLKNVERISQKETIFECSFFDARGVKSFLSSQNLQWELVCSRGPAVLFLRALTCYGLIAALVLCSVLCAVCCQYVLQFEVLGLEEISKSEIVEFVKENFSQKKSEISTEEVEIALVDSFERVSFASCIIKGQTMVINIKEKLLPDELYGTFEPLLATKSGKVTSIELVSGTAAVSVGDIVQAGDVLVQPFVTDTSGQVMQVEACAVICAEVYNVGSADHYETQIVVERTGNVAVKSEILLFGLTIYTFAEECDFAMSETETEIENLSENLFLPFKIRKTFTYELTQTVINSTYEEAEENVVATARQNALQNVEDQQLICEEFHTVRHIAGVSIVTYTIVTQEVIS